MDLLSLPVVMIENIFTYLSYDEIAKNRLVSRAFNEICSRMLNRGFMMIERRHALALKNVKAQLPRRESERRYHHLSRHCDILTSIETRISMLNMTYSKFIDNGLCSFIPGKVIDEIRRVLTIVETSTTPPRAHEVLQELRDISSMAIEHFDDKISPAFRKRLQEGVAQPPPRPPHGKIMEEKNWPSDENTKEAIRTMLEQMAHRTAYTDELELVQYFGTLATHAANTNDTEEQLLVAEQCRKWVTDRTSDPPYKEMMAGGILPVLIQCLQKSDAPTLQREAAWAITNFAMSSEHVISLVAAGAIPNLIQLLESPDVRPQALCALANIIADDPIFRDLVIETGIVETLLSYIKPEKSISFLRIVTRVIKNLCYEHPLPPVKTIQELLLALKVLITYTDTDILLRTVCTICNITDQGSEQIQYVIDSGIVPELMPLLVHNHYKIRRQVLSAVSNIVVGEDAQKQVVINCGDLCNCHTLLSHQNSHICKYVAWVISSITPRNALQVQTVIEASLLVKDNVLEKLKGEISGNAIPVILEELVMITVKAHDSEVKVAAMQYCRTLLSPFVMREPPYDELIAAGIIPILVQYLSASDLTVQRAAAGILSNIALGTSSQTNELVVAGAVPALVNLLESQEVREQAIWALANISSDNTVFRDLVIELGALKPLPSYIEAPNLPLREIKHIAWFIWTLCTCSGENLPPIENLPDILTTLNVLFTYSEYTDILYIILSILLVFSFLPGDNDKQIQMIIDSGIVKSLVPFLSHTEQKMQAMALRVILKIILNGTDEQKQFVINSDALYHFPNLLSHSDDKIFEVAVCCLSNITGSEQKVQLLIDAGILPIISERLSKSNVNSRTWAAFLVSKICEKLTKKHLVELIKWQIITHYCDLLSCGDEETITFVLNGISNIVKIDCEEAAQVAKILVMNVAHAENSEAQKAAVYQCWELLSTVDDPPIDEMIAAGILPILVHCLLNIDNPTLYYEIVCIFTNISAGTLAQKKEIVNTGVVPVLIQLLRCPYDNVREKATWALGNLIGDEPEIRNSVIEAGVVQPLLSFLNQDTSVFFLPEVAKVIINLCRSKKSLPPDETVNEILQTLNTFILQAEVNSLVGLLKAIICLAEGGIKQIQMVIKSGILRKIIPLLSHSEMKVQATALLALCNIVNYEMKQAQVVLENGALSYFPALLSHQDNRISVDAAGFLSILTQFGKKQIQAVIDAGLLPHIVETVATGEFETKKWAAFAVTNICVYGTKKQIMALINYDVVPPYCNLLIYEDTDLLCWVLDGLLKVVEKVGENIPRVVRSVRDCGGLEKIKALRGHPNSEIDELAIHIIRRNFSDYTLEMLDEDSDCCVI